MTEVENLARQVVNRVLSVYRKDYIDRMDRDEPESLLGLVKQLERSLPDNDSGGNSGGNKAGTSARSRSKAATRSTAVAHRRKGKK